MAEEVRSAQAPEASAISAEAMRKAEEFIEADEGAINRLSGLAGQAVTTVAVAMSLFHLYAAVAGAWPFQAFPIISTQPLRYAHVAFVLILSFMLFPMAARFRNRIRWFDVVLGIAGAAILVYAIEGGEDFTDRATMPNKIDVILGVTFIVLLLEATRRTTGWIVPVVALAFLAYAYFGPYLPQPWTHRGFDVGQIIGQLFITLEGIFGIPVDVSSSLIVLFCIYGAFLQHSGAGKFFIDFSLARRHDRDDRRGRLSDDGEGRIRKERRRRIARGGRARRDHLAAGARRGRVPDRRVPQDQLSRRDLDGADPDLSLLPLAAVHGGARRQALRRADGVGQARADAL
jgi:hypothetical protein